MSRNLHVLLIDDEAIEAEFVSAALTKVGHSVEAVRTVETAHAALSAKHSIDVVLLDLKLGDERGESIFERLTLGGIIFPPVIILSAESHSELAMAAKRIKGASFLRKPAAGHQIVEAIEAAMNSYTG